MTPIDLTAAPTELRTPRLRLQSPRAEHAAPFAEALAASRPELGFVSWGQQPRDLAWAQRFCDDEARVVAEGRGLAFHVLEAADGGWVGRIDIHTLDLEAARGEIGYVGHSQHAGRGLMREATLAVIELCFGLGFERIEAMSDARNTRALRFADSLGLQREGLLRRHERDLQGHHCDMVLFAALRPQGAALAAPYT